MSLTLYAHPFSSYSQKVLIALYENATAFEWRVLDGSPEVTREWATLWPMAQMPLLRDGERVVIESTVIIEHLQIHHPGPVRLLPADPAAALEVRFMDRVFDQHVMGPMQAIVNDFRRPAEQRHPPTVHEARNRLEQIYAWLDSRLAGRTWAVGEDFGLAECAAAPSLFYADWVHEIAPAYERLRSYRTRLLERASFKRAVEEARPFRGFFPPGAPDRD
ncbi:MAG TPA: glutathione S-transferase family protein [Burkholderiaceae bacterium]|jgi:glutathione S-transferase|nr:glutathione S-transferase family protein [Burkholderiaceae bacterium]